MQGKVQRKQARKMIKLKAGKERHQGRQGKVKKQVRRDTKTGSKERYKGRHGQVQRQARKGTK